MNEIYLSYEEFAYIPDEDRHGIYETEELIFYYVNGKCHRTDGPAIIAKSKQFVSGWFLNDKEYSEEEFKTKVYLMNNKLDNYV